MSSKRLSMIAVRQQRRGTALSQRKSAIDEIITVYPDTTKRLSTGSGDTIKRLSWIEKVRNRNVFLSSKGKVILETRFPTDLRGIFSLRFSPDGEKVVTAYGVGAIKVWHTETDKNCITVKSAPNHGDPITSIRFLRNTDLHKFFAAGTAGILYLCGMNAGDYHDFVTEVPNEINAVDVDLDGETVVTGGKDAVLRLYDIQTRKLKLKFSKDEGLKSEADAAKFHRMRIFAVRFHPDQKDVLLSGGWDNCVKIWDVRVKDGSVRAIRGPHICGDALDILDSTILTGSWTVENSLQLWDFTSGKLIETITPVNRPRAIDGEFLYCSQFFAGDCTGNTIVCGGSGLCCVEVIDVAKNRISSYFNIQKCIQAMDTTSKFLAFGGMENVFKVTRLL